MGDWVNVISMTAGKEEVGRGPSSVVRQRIHQWKYVFFETNHVLVSAFIDSAFAPSFVSRFADCKLCEVRSSSSSQAFDSKIFVSTLLNCPLHLSPQLNIFLRCSKLFSQQIIVQSQVKAGLIVQGRRAFLLPLCKRNFKIRYFLAAHSFCQEDGCVNQDPAGIMSRIEAFSGIANHAIDLVPLQRRSKIIEQVEKEGETLLQHRAIDLRVRDRSEDLTPGSAKRRQ